MMDRAPRAVFFDLDGTLLDSESQIDECWRAAIQVFCDSTASGPQELLDAVALKRREFWEDRQQSAPERLDHDQADRAVVEAAVTQVRPDLLPLSGQIADEYHRRRHDVTALFPGAIRVLEGLRQRDIRTALITNGSSRTQREKIGRFGLGPYFDSIVIAGELGVGKPDERVFRRALASCTVSAEEAWIVGNDLDADIATAYRIGLYTVLVDPNHAGTPDERPGTPHRTIPEIGKLEVP